MTNSLHGRYTIYRSYLQRAAIRRMCTTFHQDNLKNWETSLCYNRRTDRQGKFEFPVDADSEYTLYEKMFPEIRFKLRAKRNILSVGGRWVQSHRHSHSLFHTSTSASNFAPFPMRYKEIEQRGTRGSTCEWPKEMREAIWIEIRANLISMQMLTWLQTNRISILEAKLMLRLAISSANAEQERSAGGGGPGRFAYGICANYCENTLSLFFWPRNKLENVGRYPALARLCELLWHIWD